MSRMKTMEIIKLDRTKLGPFVSKTMERGISIAAKRAAAPSASDSSEWGDGLKNLAGGGTASERDALTVGGDSDEWEEF